MLMYLQSTLRFFAIFSCSETKIACHSRVGVIVKMLNIVLYEPEIPQNTGNIGRFCVGTDSRLILVGKLGFSLDDKHVKRAGLDYWSSVNLMQIPGLDEFFEEFLLKNTLTHSFRNLPQRCIPKYPIRTKT